MGLFANPTGSSTGARTSFAIGALCALPLLILLISIFGPFHTDSAYLFSGLGVGVGDEVLPGSPTIDPTVGFNSFALGVRAAKDVLSGHMPWWNHYEGLGTPLLGEMNSAALFPPTLLLLLPHGQAIEHAFLQMLAGIGTFLFFRRFGLSLQAALTGGLAYEVNGVFAWLRSAIFNAAVFLPWLFFALEGLRAAAQSGQTLSQRIPSICLTAGFGALALYAGFPEEVYLYSLLLFGWAALRVVGLTTRQTATFITDLALSGALALALSAPLVVAFVSFLSEANVGGHGVNTGSPGQAGTVLPVAALVQYLFPYIYGPIFASPNQVIAGIWGFIGGYIGFMPVFAAVASLFLPNRRAVKMFLLAWIVLAVGVSHGLPIVASAVTYLPMMELALACRYLNASWIFATIFLAALFIDRMPALPQPLLRRTVQGALVVSLLLATVAALNASPLLGAALVYAPGWVSGGAETLLCLSIGVFLAALFSRVRYAAVTVSSLLVIEAIALFSVPYLSSPTKGEIDTAPVSFLQSHVGYQRVLVTPGHGLQPNYGSAFGIATLNYNDLPIPQRTVDYIKDRLDPYADAVVFLPDFPPSLPPEQQAERERIFEQRLSRYAEAGVKYLLAGSDLESYMGMTPVFRSGSMTVFELPGTRDYFSSDVCTLKPVSRDHVDAICTQTGRLIRLEVSMRGWRATVNDESVPIGLTDNTFQTIDLPAGNSHVEFTYRPPGGGLALAAALAALLIVVGVSVRACRNMLQGKTLNH